MTDEAHFVAEFMMSDEVEQLLPVSGYRLPEEGCGLRATGYSRKGRRNRRSLSLRSRPLR